MPEDYQLDTHGNAEQFAARKRLLQLFKETPIPDDQIFANLGLYIRSVILAKILYLNELYQQILPLPGVIMEFGVWWGANIALFESFRSVYEPYNRLRKVIGFDTFTGYTSIEKIDGDSPLVAEGGYGVGEHYEDYLRQVLDAHQHDNVLSHIRKYALVKGDVVDTISAYLEENPETIVALAYFDLALYKPTKKCLEALKPHLIKGSILAMDELGSSDFPGETIALREVFGLNQYKTLRSQFLPDRTYIVFE